jgi:hypothetical protein
MTGVMKKGLVLLAVVFIGYYMFHDPNGLAADTRNAAGALWDGIGSLFAALLDFIDAIKS